MSIRTKLLAAIVGLNGAILILALFLFIQTDSRSSVPWVSRSEFFRTATNAEGEGRPGAVKQLVLSELETGHWDQIYVVEDPSERNPEQHPGGVWLARSYYQGERGEHGPEVGGAERERVQRRFGRLKQAGPFLSDDAGVMAVLPAGQISAYRSYGIVAIPRDRRGGARTVYLVMIGGVIVLTAVSFWLVSKLVIYPLRGLAAAAEQIADGRFDVRVPPLGTKDELDRTIVAFNRMADEIAEYQGHLEDRVLSALTRIKKAEQHLAIAQRLAATGKLAAGLAHEINNPLGGLKNAVQALSRGDLSKEKTAQYLDLVSEGLMRIEQTVKTFLTFTPREVEPRRSDLVPVIEKALALATHRLSKRGIKLETELPQQGVAVVFGDAHELQQVVLNLLLNATDAIDEGGEGSIRIQLARERDEVVLAVEDSGRGMSPEDQDRCFDMFFTTKVVGEGTGLGLAVVHNIVTTHGGRIEVQSVAGEGSTFTIRLPADDGGEEGDSGAPSAQQADRREAPLG